MSAAERARLARAARAVLGAEATRGAARSGTLRRVIADKPAPPAGFDDVRAVPDWLPADPDARDKFVLRTGLAAMSPALARTIDGTLLRTFADKAGPELLDWALDVGARSDAHDSADIAEPSRMEPVGRAIVAAALPKPLADWLCGRSDVVPAHAQWALDRAREAA